MKPRNKETWYVWSRDYPDEGSLKFRTEKAARNWMKNNRWFGPMTIASTSQIAAYREHLKAGQA